MLSSGSCSYRSNLRRYLSCALSKRQQVALVLTCLCLVCVCMCVCVRVTQYLAIKEECIGLEMTFPHAFWFSVWTASTIGKTHTHTCICTHTQTH